jgi:hypothetical protein
VKRMVRVLAVAALVAMILVASVSPAMARKVAGGQLLSTDKPCNAKAYPQHDHPGVEFKFFEFPDPVGNPEGRAEGCWALLP